MLSARYIIKSVLILLFVSSCAQVEYVNEESPSFWLKKAKFDLPQGTKKEDVISWFLANDFKNYKYQAPYKEHKFVFGFSNVSALVSTSSGGIACNWYSTSLVIELTPEGIVHGHGLTGSGQCL